jgi:hypothetical protein
MTAPEPELPDQEEEGPPPEKVVVEEEDVTGKVKAGRRLIPLPKTPRDVRAVLAIGFALLFALTILLGFFTFWWSNKVWDDFRGFLEVILPAETALLGSAVGFYFGSRRREEEEDRQ